jgi:hypothetical protein
MQARDAEAARLSSKETPAIMPGNIPPPDSVVVTRTGPWTVLSYFTAACSRCGTVPLGDDTEMAPHFASTGQAREELTRDWGWRCNTRSNWPKDDELLCPACAKADDDGLAPSAAPFAAAEPPVWARGGVHPADLRRRGRDRYDN